MPTHPETSKRASSVFTSKPIQILVGDARTPYYIHPGVSLNSPSALNARMHGPWRVSDDGYMDWTDFDEDTVECVLEYLYTKDYHMPVSTPGEGVLGAEAAADQLTFPGLDMLNPDESARPEPDESESTEEDMPAASVPGSLTFTPLKPCIEADMPLYSKKTAAGEFAAAASPETRDCGAAIMIHAKVYCFAHRYLLSDLEHMALQRMNQVLRACDSPPFPVAELTEAIRLVYSATPNKATQNNAARNLLFGYTVKKLANPQNKDLNAILTASDDFMFDVINRLARRLVRVESELRTKKTQLNKSMHEKAGLEANYHLAVRQRDRV
ncbi:hypothetical protein BJX99DRAFT_264606 [Aspergillus californicus]